MHSLLDQSAVSVTKSTLCLMQPVFRIATYTSRIATKSEGFADSRPVTGKKPFVSFFMDESLANTQENLAFESANWIYRIVLRRPLRGTQRNVIESYHDFA